MDGQVRRVGPIHRAPQVLLMYARSAAYANCFGLLVALHVVGAWGCGRSDVRCRV